MTTATAKSLYWTAFSAILIAVILTIISLLNICKEMCSAVHQYRLMGLPFELYGLIFLPVLALLHFVSRRLNWAGTLAGLLTAGAVGMEVNFILVQKYVIKAWCPICLAIAAMIFVIASCYGIEYVLKLNKDVKQEEEGDSMKALKKALSSMTFAAIGFVFAFIGVAKEQPLKAAEASIKESVVFGKASSPVQVYFFSDWQCPACRSLEPTIEAIAPKIMNRASLVFVDTIVHSDTLNFIPYNLSFMIHNKDKYLQLRHILTDISKTTGSPSEEQVEGAIQRLGVQHQQLHYSDITVGIKYFKHLVKQFDVDATPTMIIVHRDAKTGKKLQGSEINESNVIKAIESMQK